MANDNNKDASIGIRMSALSTDTTNAAELLNGKMSTSVNASISEQKILQPNGIGMSALSNGTTNTEEVLKGKTPSTQQAVAASTGVLGTAPVATDTALASKYSLLNSRLVTFSYNDGSDDISRRAYLRIQGQTSLFEEYLKDAADASLGLKTIFAHLKSQYTSFILLSIQENLQEKQSILPTVGDSFALTFSGKEPQVMVLSGLLPVDAEKDTSLSWYVAFVNAFKYFIRASKLAKYRCYVQLVLPDFATYNLYPTSINCSINSEQDNLIPFSMTAVVVDKAVARAYNHEQKAAEANDPDTPAEGTVKDVQKDEDATEKEKAQENKTTNDPKKVGEKAQKKNFFQSVQEGINKVGREINKVAQSKTVQSLNKGMQLVSVAKGAVNILKNGSAYGQRNLSKIKGGVSSKYRG